MCTLRKKGEGALLTVPPSVVMGGTWGSGLDWVSIEQKVSWRENKQSTSYKMELS